MIHKMRSPGPRFLIPIKIIIVLKKNSDEASEVSMYGKQGWRGNRTIHGTKLLTSKSVAIMSFQYEYMSINGGSWSKMSERKSSALQNTMTSSNYNQQWSSGYYGISQVNSYYVSNKSSIILDSYTEKRKIHDSWTQINHKAIKCFLIL